MFKTTLRSTVFALVTIGAAASAHAMDSNSVSATNVAAGIGNVAQQSIGVSQAGLGGGGFFAPQVGRNDVTASNVAAGIGNRASQTINAQQMTGGPGGGFFAPHAPQIGSNSVDATNLAAGIDNRASQSIGTSQTTGQLPFHPLFLGR